MRTLKTFAAAAVLLLLAGSANAAIIITVREDVQDALVAGIELAIDFEISGVADGGLSTIGFDILHNGVFVGTCAVGGTGSGSNPCATAIDTLTYFGGQADGTNLGWGSLGAPAADGTYLARARFSIDGAPGGSLVTIGGPTLYAGSYNFTDVTSEITVNPYVVPVPEPTTAALLGLGLFGLVLGGRRR